MAEEFVNYKSFNDKAVAIELYEKLRQEGLTVEWESSVGIFDASFANDEFMHLYYVKLRKQDFERANVIMMERVKQKNERPKEGYYLYSFTTTELLDVIRDPLEWNEYDRYWAGRLLQERDVEVKEEEFTQIKTVDIDSMKKPWKLDRVWLLLPLVLIILGLYFLHFYFAIGCILIGGYIGFSKKTLPDGDRIRAFSANDRFWGKIVMITGAVFTLFLYLIRFEIVPDDWIVWPTWWGNYLMY